MSEDTVANALGLQPVPVNTNSVVPVKQENQVVQVEEVTDSEKIESDYEFARQKIKSAIDTASDALISMVRVADTSEHPRAYEVLSTLSKTIIDGSKQLVDLAKAKKELTPVKSEDTPNNVTNNNLILTTADLLKMLKGESNNL